MSNIGFIQTLGEDEPLPVGVVTTTEDDCFKKDIHTTQMMIENVSKGVDHLTDRVIMLESLLINLIRLLESEEKE